ncbi:MAG: serine/threonine protein kinase [Chlamydiia bacterium]|nr:serine/threonine protein kinase [Chlamydiia bacterium]
MFAYRLFSTLAISYLSLTASLVAIELSFLEQTTHADLTSGDFGHLGDFVRDHVTSSEQLSLLRELADKKHSSELLFAVDATSAIQTKLHSIGVTLGEFLQIALFIESRLPQYIADGKNYLSYNRTSLPYTLEYDPETKNVFIVLDEMKANFLGSGAIKTVYKAVLYDRSHPQVVARGEQGYVIRRELEITKLLKDAPGIFEIKGFGQHPKIKKHGVVIYSKLYKPGALRNLFNKRITLTLHEKMSVALDILNGLESIHKLGIVHRDLNPGNFLIDISSGKPGGRKVVAAIADLERANYAKNVAHSKVQGAIGFTSPEGLFLQKMKGSDYFAADVYAVGLIFYHLFYEKRASWFNGSYVREVHIPLQTRYAQLVHRINRATKEKRQLLQKKRKSLKITVNEAFELLILKMVHPDPKKRGTASELCQEMASIFKKATVNAENSLR